VGTVTELHDYLRLLYARVGTPHCPDCGREVGEQSAQNMVERILELPEGTRLKLAAPVVRDQKGAFEDLFEELVSEGYARVEIDGEEYDLTMDDPDLDENFDHTVDVIVDRVKVSAEDRPRIIDSVETALDEAEGVLKVILPEASAEVAADLGEEARRTGALGEETEENDRFVVEFSKDLACTHCGIDIPEIETRSFSFNSPHGACPECEGLGETKEVDEDLVLQDESKPLKHVFEPWSYNRSYYQTRLDAVAEHFGVSLSTPFEDLEKDIQQAFLYGTDGEVLFKRRTKTAPAGRKSVSRALSPTSSGATSRPTPTRRGSTSRTTCRRRRVRPATAPG